MAAAPIIDPTYKAVIAETVAETIAALMKPGAWPLPRFVNSQQAAARIGIKNETLATMRGRGLGPNYSGAGKFIRYEVIEVDRWIAEQPRASASDEEVAS